MARFTFTGGIYPYSGKSLSRDKEIRTILPGEDEMVFLLKQHIGAPSIPVVREGDAVLAGQLIARADGELSSNLHSSVSGRVLRVGSVYDVTGKKVDAIIIENDRQYAEVMYPKNRDLKTLSRKSVLSIIKDAGIVGMGGSGLPTHYKLLHSNEKIIDTVIANCIECEPYLTSDYRRILEDPWKVINGLMVLLHVYPKARGIIALSESNREGYRLLSSLLLGNSRITVRRCKDKYPQGSERQLIHALTGRTLNAKMLPCEIGCMVLNTDTLVAVNQAVILHEPLITRIVTVSGPSAASCCNLRVRCGTTYRDVLEQAGGLKRGCRESNTILLDGGPLTGRRIVNLDAPITKLSSAITCFSRKDLQQKKESICIRCRRCVEVCPSRIVPMQLYQDAISDRKSVFVENSGLECCECGCCSYVCPAGINLTEKIRNMKHTCLQNEMLAGDYAKRYQRQVQ